MTEEKKALTAGNVRLIIILGFVLGLAIVFQAQIKESMSNGCFDFSLGYSDLGIKMSDKRYCSGDDIKEFSAGLIEAGAESVREEADSLVEVYNQKLVRMAGLNEELSIKLNEEMKFKNELTQQKKRFDRYLASKVSERSTTTVAREISGVFNETFSSLPSEPVVYQEMQVISPEQVKIQSAEIRNEFDTRSRVKVEKINESITIKR